MIFKILAAIGFVLALLHLAMQKWPWTRQRIAEVLLLYAFVFPIGLGGLVGFAGHTMRAAPVAASIGGPAGNPFQYEVAVANLAFGVLGLLCLRFRDGFWDRDRYRLERLHARRRRGSLAPDPHRPAIRSWQCRSHPTFQYRCADLRACASCGSQRSKSDCAQRGCAGRPSGLKPRRSRYPVSRG